MRRVLVVDDKEENVYYLRSLLGSLGWQVDSAPNGVEALKKAREHRPDLVISDLLMPVMDGFSLLRAWKSDADLRRAPFIVLTATYTDSSDEQLARTLGADDFILKPAEPEQILSRIDALRSVAPVVPGPLGTNEKEILVEYSETLVRKLEKKSLLLEESNRNLKADIEARERVEAALRESEANFRLVIEAIPQLVFIARPDGHAIYFNERWRDETGFSASRSEGDGWLDAIETKERTAFEKAWRHAVESERPLAMESRLRRSDGSFRWSLVRSVPFRDAAGVVSKWLGTFTDIHDLKQAAERLTRAEEQLRQAQKMEAVGQLAAGVAHDFNNLLTVILSYSSYILGRLPANAPLRTDVEPIQQAGERAVALTRQLLTFGRKQVLNPRHVDVRDVVANIESMLRRLLREDVELVIHRDNESAVAFIDANSLEQILVNLVVNARDAMADGGTITVDVTRASVDEAYAAVHPEVTVGSYIKLSVQDTGHGMDEATKARIFEPFFTTKAPGKGTGLGLATVYGIASQMQGKLLVESVPGRGTTFTLFLPPAGGVPSVPVADPVALERLHGTETILLVEDSHEVRSVIHAVLGRAGYQVIEAATPADALLSSERIDRLDLVLTDVVMPRMSGPALAKRVQQVHPDAHVLYTSGYTEDAAVDLGILERGAPFLAKPITPESLLRKVRDVLGRPDGGGPRQPAVRQEVEAQTDGSAKGRILLVDDEVALVKLMARILEGAGYRVAGFTSPMEALRAFKADPDAFDAVVADVSLPELSGFELIRLLRRHRPDVPAVVTSGYFRPEDMESAKSLEIRSLLAKPDGFEKLGLALHDEIRRALELKASAGKPKA